MKVDYANRAIADLHKISADSRRYGEPVTAALDARIREIVAQIAKHPDSAPRVTNDPAFTSSR